MKRNPAPFFSFRIGVREEVFVFSLFFALTFILKAGTLNSPYFEDEKFWWIPSALYVSEHYPAIIIGEGIPKEIRGVPKERIPDHSYRIPDFGHPPIYFLLYGTIFLLGHSRVIAHLLTILIVTLLLYIVYLIARRLEDSFAGIMAGLALLITPPFLEEAGRCNLDLPASLFAMAAIYGVVAGKYPFYLLFSSLTLLTKETGVLIVVPAGLFLLAGRTKNRGWEGFLKGIHLMILPFLPLLLFLVIHRIQTGWWLYTARYYNFSVSIYLYSLLISLKFIFLDQGRFLLSIPMAGYMLLKGFRGEKRGEAGFILLLLSIIFFHLIVLSFVDFRVVWQGGEMKYTHIRYFIPALPPLFLLSAVYIRRGVKRWWFLLVLILLFIAVSTLSYHTKPRLSIEENLHYLDLIQAEKEGLRFIENLKERGTIWVDPSLYLDLNFPYIGFVNEPLDGVRLLGKDPANDGIKEGDILLEPSYGHPLHEVRKFFHLKKIFEARVHQAVFSIYVVM